MELADLKGQDLGTHLVAYDQRDAILYNLTVGAGPEQLELVYERDLRVLPCYGCALGLWAVEAAGDLGAYDRKLSLHASQELKIHRPLPASGKFEMTGSVTSVWDKGRASVVNIEAVCEFFTAGYSIFLPGRGDWGGERGPSSASEAPEAPTWSGSYRTWDNHAALYRLTGDLHPIHIDPQVAAANGFDRAILHGLCTLGIAAREVATAAGAHACDLTFLGARLSAPVLPGDLIEITAEARAGKVIFEANSGTSTVLKSGVARFG